MPRRGCVVVGVAMAVALTAGCGRDFWTQLPSDAVMIAHLRAQRAAFDELVAMATKDRVIVRLHPNEPSFDDTPPAVPLTPARLARYRELLAQVGARRVFPPSPGEPANVSLPFAAGGLPTSGSYKGFTHAVTPPPRLRPSLDRYAGEVDVDFHRHVEGPWYLYRWDAH